MQDGARSRGGLTYEAYKCFPEDGLRHEIIDGFHVSEPSPTTYHQRISGRIHYQLFQQVELAGLGVVFHAPTDVQLSDHDVVVPDLVVVLEPSRLIVTPSRIRGTPQLIVEILSASSVERDRDLKMALYERSGVGEYWIVDPDGHVVEQYVLAEGRYRLAGSHAETIAPERIPGVQVDLTEVW